MHIAVCDYNIADRRRLERLLSRASDNLTETTGVFYIDAYGDEPTLFRSPMLYDLFFIDMIEGTRTGMDISEKLRENGVTAPIVMCSGDIDYRTIPQTIPNLYHLKKPINTALLTDMLLKAYAAKSSERSTIELRDEENTYYIFPEDIMWAKEEKRITTVTLSDSTKRRSFENIGSLYAALEKHPEFVYTKKKYVVNRNFIDTLSRKELTLLNRDTIPLSLSEFSILKRWLQK